MSCNLGGHQADRPSTSYEYVFACNRKGQCSVNSITEWVKDCAEFGVNGIGVHPNIARRDDHIFGKCSVAIDSNT